MLRRPGANRRDAGPPVDVRQLFHQAPFLDGHGSFANVREHRAKDRSSTSTWIGHYGSQAVLRPANGILLVEELRRVGADLNARLAPLDKATHIHARQRVDPDQYHALFECAVAIAVVEYPAVGRSGDEGHMIDARRRLGSVQRVGEIVGRDRRLGIIGGGQASVQEIEVDAIPLTDTEVGDAVIAGTVQR